MRITSVRSTYCFVASGGRLAQVVQVAVAGAEAGTEATVSVAGPSVRTAESWRGQLSPALAGRPGGPAWAPSDDAGISGPGRFSPSPERPAGVVVEVPVLIEGGHRLGPGDLVPARATASAGAGQAEAEADLVVREPGWRMFMVCHFHYDPVWWNTQAGYTSGWDELLWALERRETFQHTGLALVEAHLERARLDPRYKFVLAEVDYLKPFWDLYPDRREQLRALVRAGRLEIVGGTYNEPNTNLTGAETAIRAAVYGLGFQRGVVGANPTSAWQLDVFGHDPQFPGIMAECGLRSSAWARGPFHQWGPRKETGSNSWMQFPSEFEWVAPNGRGLLTSYMPNHYSAGWDLEGATTLEGAMWRAYELFCDLAEVAATRATLLPVGTDYTPPSRWVSDVAEAWGARYAWPRFEVGLPEEFFAAVSEELSRQGRRPSPQSRDMNPIYTGKDVSFIDTKQAQRLAESCLADAEAMAALASLVGAPVPQRALDKAWRQLVFGAHHDGITGSESDQVYLDLLGGWRESYELARAAEEHSREALVSAIDTSGASDVGGEHGRAGGTSGTEGTSGAGQAGAGAQAVVVTNTLGQDRSELAAVEVPQAQPGEAYEVRDGAGQALPTLGEAGPRPGRTVLRFPAAAVPGVGYRSFTLVRRRAGDGAGAAPAGRGPRRAWAGTGASGGNGNGGSAGTGAGGGSGGWAGAPGLTIANEHLEVTADPGRGGGLARVRERTSGFELLPEGEVANELVVYPEYPNHPRFGEGPWHLLHSGPPARSRSAPAAVWRQASVLGERLVVEGRLAYGAAGPGGRPEEGVGYRQVVTLWHGCRRLELRTELHGWVGKDRLVRLRFPTTLIGATPVSAVGDAVVARGFALIEVDSAEAPWTLDNPAAEWFGLSTTLVVEAVEVAGGAGAGGAGAGGSGAAYHRRSVGVAEVVTATGASAAPWARELVVALVQKGVTATCSEAPANRYGALRGDSNLPDFRVAVGTPADNAFIGELLQHAGPIYRRFFEDQLERQGSARLLVPAARSLAEVWSPNADLRGARDLPVLVVAGAGPEATAAAVAGLVAEVVTGRVRVAQPAGLVPRREDVPEWTAAIFNRGTPGFAVDTAGAMHVSLLRACSGWPSGVWIDPPRRSAPDGSAFELEHWSHVFDHALLLARGDWRQAGCVTEALAYNRPLRATLAGPHPGPLPRSARLFSLAPAGGAGDGGGGGAGDRDGGRAGDRDGGMAGDRDGGMAGGIGEVVLAALKPAGNPLAEGDPAPLEGTGGRSEAGVELALRCYEAAGRPVDVELRSWFPLRDAHRADLLDKAREQLAVSPTSGAASGRGGSGTWVRFALHAGELATVRLGLPVVGPGQGAAAGAREAPQAGPSQTGPARGLSVEAAQPVFSRYWLHNKGAAPMGNQGLAVHFRATSLVVRAGEAADVMAQVASGAAHATQAGHLELVAPDGWALDPPGRLFSLAPGAFVAVPVRVRVPGTCTPGRRFVAARVTDEAGQAQEDVLTVDVLPRLAEAVSLDGHDVNGHDVDGHEGHGHPLLALPAPFGHPSGQVPAELEAVLEAEELVVPAGVAATLGLRLSNRTAGELRGEAQLLTPVETWPWVAPRAQGFAVPPGAAHRVEATVRAPETGWLSSWALFKVTYFGRLWYSPSVRLVLGDAGWTGGPSLSEAARHASRA
ncbi:MAG: NEW3 domain-containing protein [Acidimicrobiales bacterium]